MKSQPPAQSKSPAGDPASAQVAGGAIRTTAVVLTLAGLVIMLVAIFADQLGIGGGHGFGWKQLIIAILGLVMVLIGVAWFLQPPATPAADEFDDTDVPPPNNPTDEQARQDMP